MKRPDVGDLIKVTWIDIHSDSGWISEEILEPAHCTNVGIFNGFHKGNIRMFASFNEWDIGDRITIPKNVIKDITVLRKNFYGRNKSSNKQRLRKRKRT